MELTFVISISSMFRFHHRRYFLEIIFCYTKSKLLWMLVFLDIALWLTWELPYPPWPGMGSTRHQAVGSPRPREWPSGYPVGPIWWDASFLLPPKDYFLLKTQGSSWKTATPRKCFLETFSRPFITPRIKHRSGFSHKTCIERQMTHHF